MEENITVKPPELPAGYLIKERRKSRGALLESKMLARAKGDSVVPAEEGPWFLSSYHRGMGEHH